ncbi:AraC family transcriptional regulator [Paraburkholderia sacchari]|uniref:hemerythrin domain-containing protein n=1 Tax=Paraburkholderia sacchari TaxID=159450 RepID=UPI0039A58465
MTNALARWHADHVNFVRLLDLLDEQVAAFHLGETSDYVLMSDILYYLRDYSDRFHHPPEDVAYARLVERDPGTRLIVNRLLQEHRVIATAGEELFNRLNDAAADVLAPRADLEAATATYLVYYRHHIFSEERDIMARAAQALTEEDWAAVAAAVQAGPDPLFGDNVLERFIALRRKIAPDV